MDKEFKRHAEQWARMIKKRVRPGKGSIRVALDIYNCKLDVMRDHARCQRELRAMVEEQDLGFMGILIVPFEGGGYELLVVLRDSFIVVETWPHRLRKKRYVKVVVDICHFRRDNTMRALMIAAAIRTLFHTRGVRTDRIVTHHGPR